MEVVKAHYTAGYFAGDDAVGRRGYFQWLVDRDGSVYQYAEADALCYDSGEWNDNGPGIEISYRDQPTIFTEAARVACSGLIRWLHTEWNIPLEYWDGGRIAETTGYRGFIAHRDLVQTEQHSDYWPQEDWDAMTNLAPLPLEETMWLILDTATLNNWLATANGMTLVPNEQVMDLVAAGIKRYDVDTRTVAWLGKNLRGTGGSVTIPAGPLKVTLTGTAIPAV